MARRAAEADAASPFDPPYTTTTVNVFNGGTAANITAGRAQFLWDCRAAEAGASRDVLARFSAYASELEAAARQIAEDCRITTETLANGPPLLPQAENRAADLARALTGENATHVVAYGAEAGQFQEKGFHAVICGPGAIAQAHQPNEFISLDQVAQGTQFLRKLIKKMAS